MAMKIGQRSTLNTLAWKGVMDLEDPYAIPKDRLMRARNLYLPDPGSGAGAYGRPGFELKNADAPIASVLTGRYGQALTVATIEDGTLLNFCVVGGRLFRVSGALDVYTDVTPAGITIDPTSRVHLTPFSNRLIVQDDVNTPWVASNLEATPVTGTAIQYSTLGAPWRAYGPAVVYGGSIFFIVRARDTDVRTSRIAWSEADDPLTGYFQGAFDNEWDIVENGTTEIYALWATNLALYYIRDDSIGYLTGDVGPDLKTTATHDAIGVGIGTRAPAGLAGFDKSLFFVDTAGRPQKLAGEGIKPIWKQLRRVIKTSATRWVDLTARTAIGAIVPELDLYVVAIWSNDPTQVEPQFPTTMYAFNAATGTYVGEWTIGPGIAVHSIGALASVDGQRVLAVLGTKLAAGAPQALGDGGYLWVLHSLEDGVWSDNDELPDILATSPPLGYSPDMELSVDGCVAIVQEIQTDDTPALIDLAIA